MTIGELPPRGPDLRGVLLGRRYQLDHVLGSGGSGDVYTALDRRLRRAVAVKVLFPEYARDEDQRRRIRQEALVGAQVSHPNVAPIFDFGEEVGACREALLFIVMPLLEGRTLREVVAGGALHWRAAGVWVHQLLRERFASAREFDAALVDVLVAHGVDVRESPSFAGCGEAQASLAAWHAFDRGRARARAEAAAKLNRAWSPLALLLSLAPES